MIHAILFGTEALLLLWAIERNATGAVIVLTVGWCVLFGGALEVVQYYLVEGRHGDVIDLLADTAGALGGVGLAKMLIKN